jgi:hypothetical protein
VAIRRKRRGQTVLRLGSWERTPEDGPPVGGEIHREGSRTGGASGLPVRTSHS